MDTVQLIVLALVQGITEFLPISSSAHLILTPWLFGWADQGVVMDIALHFGTLLAVLVYFWRDTFTLLRGSLDLCTRRWDTEPFRRLWHVIIATLPLLPFGLLLMNWATDSGRSLIVIGCSTIFFGLVLWVADARSGLWESKQMVGWLAKVWPEKLLPKVYRRIAEWLFIRAREEQGGEKDDISSIHWPHALVFGVFQGLALIPGTSRSGSCISAGRLLGFSRGVSARFASLMAIPTITLALLVSLLRNEALATLNWSAAAGTLLSGMALAFVAAWVGLWLLMTFFKKIGYLPFVYYRLMLGTALLVWGLA